jgi:NAD(P)-dependent dehydrogenase (short-subunit alcohol dehydrogenase family)
MTNQRRTALVTGGNKGIGLAVVRELARAGFTTWLGSRDETRGREAARALAAEGDVRFVALDVADEYSVTAAAKALAEASPSLELLVNNAGIYVRDGDGPPSRAQPHAMRATWDVNVLGPLRVTQAMLPLLRSANAARVVMVGSGTGSLTRLSDPNDGVARFAAFAYNSSKAALNVLTVMLSNELRAEGIAVNVVNPGFVATDLNGHTGLLTTGDAARVVVAAADRPLDESGRFLTSGGTLPW